MDLNSAYINRSGAFGGFFNFKLNALVSGESLKFDIDKAALMKKHFSSVGCADKTKTSVVNELIDFSGMHEGLLKK